MWNYNWFEARRWSGWGMNGWMDGFIGAEWMARNNERGERKFIGQMEIN
jgi:hypothetical protein